MKKLLCSSKLVMPAAAIFLFSITSSKAQVINEGFEESIWSTIALAANQGTTSGPVVITQTSASSTVTYITSNNSTATATSINTSPNSGTWIYSKGTVTTVTANRRSSSYGWNMPSAGGFLITPVLNAGVTSVNFWAGAGSTTTPVFTVGINTNASITNTSATAYNSSQFTYATASFSLANSNMFSNGELSVPASFSFSGPCRIMFYSGAGTRIVLDDIVVTSPAPMPVTISSVKAFQKAQGIQVEWNVGAERDMMVYEVEKSVNGYSFDKIGEVTAGNIKSYNWFDASPNNGSNFYRIKMIGKDNLYTYSNVMSVKLGGVKGDIAVYPNPVKSNVINVQFTNLEKGTYNMQLINSLGQCVYSSKIVHNGGSGSEALQLNGALNKGIYQLIVNNGSTKQTLQVLAE